MKFEITGSSGFELVDVILNTEERFFAQPKSMVSMQTGITLKPFLLGSNTLDKKRIGSGLITAFKGSLAGESFFITEYLSNKDHQKVSFAPENVGKILEIDLRTHPKILIAKGAFLAHTDGVVLEAKYAGLKGFMSKKGLFLLKASGDGVVFISSYGDIVKKELVTDERVAIDNDYVLAFSDELKYELVTATKGLSGSFFSGEGLVNRYTGPGIVYYQTRSKLRSSIIGRAISTMT